MGIKILSMEERIRLAEEELDLLGKDARIFPPPINVSESYSSESEFPSSPEISRGNGRYIKNAGFNQK